MTPSDQCARFAAKQLDAEGFLRWCLPEAFGKRRWSGWLDTQTVGFPGENERRCDTVAVFERIGADAPPVVAVIEFMSRPRGETRERLAEYALRVRRERPFHVDPLVQYEVVTVLFSLTGPPQSDTWSMTPEDFGGLGLSSRFKVITLREVDAQGLLASVATGTASRALLAWLPLMRGAEHPAVAEEWSRLALLEPDVRKRADYGGLAKVFATLADRSALWNPILKGWNMEESLVVREWLNQGRDEGRAEVLNALQSQILSTAQRRFQVPMSPDVSAVVKAQIDPIVIYRWACLANEAPDLAAFRTGLGLK